MDTTLDGLAAKIDGLVVLQAISTFLADDAKAQSNVNAESGST